MRKEISLLPYIILLALAGCVAKRPMPERQDPAEVFGPAIPIENVQEETVPTLPDSSPTEAYGPTIPPEGVIPAPEAQGSSTATTTSTSTATTDGSEPSLTPSESAKLCLVLGPGMAKAMAQAAVLATLKKAKIPIHCLVGTEMGAIVGALYSFSNGSTNNMQWQLFKLSKENYFNFPMLSLRDPRSSGGKLNEFFSEVFKGKKTEDLPIAFGSIAVDDERDSNADLTSGNLADNLSASIAIPGIFDSWRIGETKFHSAALTDPLPVELARKLGGTFVVAVDVLSESGPAGKSRFAKAFAPAKSLMKLQRKEASFVIQVATTNIQYDDFARQGEILSAGTAAAEKALPELKAAWERASAGTR
jgi:NTE family protein